MIIVLSDGIFAAGGAKVTTQEKKNITSDKVAAFSQFLQRMLKANSCINQQIYCLGNQLRLVTLISIYSRIV